MRQLIFLLFILLFAACAAPAPAATPTNTANPPTLAQTRAPAQTTAPPPGNAQSQNIVATATLPPTQRPTARPPLPPSDTPAPTPLPSPTRASAQLIQLMDGACCSSPGWFSDSETILFIDKPNADAPTGMYAVNLNAPMQSKLWNERIAFYTREFDYAQIPEAAGTRLIRTTDGKEIRIKNGGRTVTFSPDRTRVVWTETRETFPIENRVSSIMLAPIDFDGTGVGEAERVLQILRGGVSGWLDNHRLLVNGRLARDTEDSTTFVYDLDTGKQTVMFTAERSRLTTISRGGTWLAFVIVNDKDATRDGLWVIRTDGTNAKKLELFGAAQWRNDTHLIIAPFALNAPTHAFYDYDVETGATQRLTPATQPFKITSGDWAVSPDGQKIVFVNAADNNLWLWKFSE